MRFQDKILIADPDWQQVMPTRKLRKELPKLGFNGKVGWYLCDTDTVLVTYAGRCDGTKHAQSYPASMKLWHVRVWNAKSTPEFSPAAVFHTMASAPVQVDSRSISHTSMKAWREWSKYCSRPRKRKRKVTIKSEDTALYTMYLTEAGNARLSVIKLVRELTSLGLRESKDLVEATDLGGTQIVLENVSKAKALQARAAFISIGADAIVTQSKG